MRLKVRDALLMKKEKKTQREKNVSGNFTFELCEEKHLV